MIELLKVYQLDIMLVLSGITGILAVLAFITNAFAFKKRILLGVFEVGVTVLLTFDRFAYIFRGDTSSLGYVMVRLSNFMVFAFTIIVIEIFCQYVVDLLKTDVGIKHTPRLLVAAHIVAAFGLGMLVISQLTDFYYSFDSSNRYQRGDGFYICYLIPVIILVLVFIELFKNRKKIRKAVFAALILFSSVPLVAAAVQAKIYGVSLVNISMVVMAVFMYVLVLYDMNNMVLRMHKEEVEYLQRERKGMQHLFDQTAVSFMGAVDAKNSFTKGHSVRVANYSRMLANLYGMSEDDADKVYYAALLHDIGKVSIDDKIILESEEAENGVNEIFMNHTRLGERILGGIKDYPYLTDVAHFHHERYDGEGYPEGIKGDDIPIAARIVAVADVYDNMTSKKSFRDPLPQSRVREEFVTEAGFRFDPIIAKLMVNIIDEDVDYRLKQSIDETEDLSINEIKCEAYRNTIYRGIPITENVMKIKMNFIADETGADRFSVPAAILFDSMDGRVHHAERYIEENRYFEYGEIWFDGHCVDTNARDMKMTVIGEHETAPGKTDEGTSYEIEVGRYKDQARVRIFGGEKDYEIVVALPDRSRYVFIGLTGEHCELKNIETIETDEVLKEGDIERIAEEISYTNRMESDIKNIQVDGYCANFTDSVPVKDEMRIAFYSMTLPAARFVWHCPYVVLFYSDDKKPHGLGYKEFALIRLDGEIVETDESAENKVLVTKGEEFESWNAWKDANKKGMEVVVNFRRKGNKVTVTSENMGIFIKNVTTVDKDIPEIYAAITGDQCAITDIRII